VRLIALLFVGCLFDNRCLPVVLIFIVFRCPLCENKTYLWSSYPFLYSYLLVSAAERGVHGNDLAHRRSPFCLLLVPIPPFCGDILPSRVSVQCPHMALPRPNNEVTSSFRSTLVWWPRILRYRVGRRAVLRVTPCLDQCFSASRSPHLHERYVRELGRSIRIRGLHPVCVYPRLQLSE